MVRSFLLAFVLAALLAPAAQAACTNTYSGVNGGEWQVDANWSAAHIPTGSTIDTRRGRIAITAAQGKGKTASADFYDGLFTLTQTKGSKPVTTLTLTEALSCPKSGAKASAATVSKKKKTRKLWGDGSGSFRTRGQYSAATVRGTRWLVQDSCGKTLTKVAKGVVEVQDFVKRKKILVRAPKSYTAKQKRR